MSDLNHNLIDSNKGLELLKKRLFSSKDDVIESCDGNEIDNQKKKKKKKTKKNYAWVWEELHTEKGFFFFLAIVIMSIIGTRENVIYISKMLVMHISGTDKHFFPMSQTSITFFPCPKQV